ncbi:MAG TPA: hypothetical protein VMB52_01625 [Verrucomicrobiae bacterium]|nr:hypothetical protein [Verrucomicrobiae bacterium]
MSDRFSYFVVEMEAVAGTVRGVRILEVLSSFIEVDSIETKIDKNKITFRIVTSMTKDDMWHVCDEVKKLLEEAYDGRLIYKIIAIS